jgi:hypothetical protein
MKLFIIAPHFPPSALPPAQRVRLMMPHLKKLGVEATVFTTSPKNREEKEDAWMLELAGNDYKFFEVASLNQKWSRKFGFGDLGLRMLPFLFFKLWRQIKSNRPDFILYPVPPWYILLIAPILKMLTCVPYAIDFIDPWVAGGELSGDASFKKKTSQLIARKLEGFVTKNASLIYSVSDGINEQLIERHPELKCKEMFAIPYGAEQSDYLVSTSKKSKREEVLVRYIGAVWEDAYPTLDALFKVLSETNHPFRFEFYGTSYAGEGLAKSQLNRWLNTNELQLKVKEYPDRVPYREAVELNMESDILLLFGGMQPYYAASKLFGLIVSQKPFIAFLHRDSFPAKFLKSFNYAYLVEYSHNPGDLPIDHINALSVMIHKCLTEFNQFEPLDLNDLRIKGHTALGMTTAFIDPIKAYLKKK